MKVRVSVFYDWPYGEDFPVTGRVTFGVIDGATPIGGSRVELFEFVRRLSFYLLKYESWPLKKSLEYALENVFFPEHTDKTTYELPSAAGAVMRINDDNIELFRAADCSVVIKYDDGIKIIDDSKVEYFDQLAWNEYMNYVERGYSRGEAKEIVYNGIIREVRKRMGVEYFPLYPGADVDKFSWYSFGVDGVEAVALMSDGFYRYVSHFGGNVEDFFNVDGAVLMERLRKFEEKEFDNLKRGRPFFKKHDDATLIVVWF